MGRTVYANKQVCSTSCAQKLVNPPQNAHNYALLNYYFIVEPCDKTFKSMMFSMTELLAYKQLAFLVAR